MSRVRADSQEYVLLSSTFFLPLHNRFEPYPQRWKQAQTSALEPQYDILQLRNITYSHSTDDVYKLIGMLVHCFVFLQLLDKVLNESGSCMKHICLFVSSFWCLLFASNLFELISSRSYPLVRTAAWAHQSTHSKLWGHVGAGLYSHQAYEQGDLVYSHLLIPDPNRKYAIACSITHPQSRGSIVRVSTFPCQAWNAYTHPCFEAHHVQQSSQATGGIPILCWRGVW